MFEWIPVAYAFGAGMLATGNPCGFLMLPSYVAFYMGGDEGSMPPAVGTRLRRGATLSIIVTVGFMVLFVALGSAISLGSTVLFRFFPMAGVVVGAVMVGVGTWLLVSRRSLGIYVAKKFTTDFRRSIGGAFTFGVAYGLASLSCTLPVFMVVVGSALTASGVAAALSQFVSYSIGMGVVVTTVVLSASFFRGVLQRYIQWSFPYLHYAGSVFLIGAGGYLVYRGIRYGGFF